MNESVMVTAPLDTPVTTPAALTVAIAALAVSQVPPADTSERVTLLPIQVDNVPVIPEGAPFTVTVTGTPEQLDVL
jgi:hypothetical protein